MTIFLYKYTETLLVLSLSAFLEKSLSRNQTCLVVCDDEQLLSKLDASLWTFASAKFIPHAKYPCDNTFAKYTQEIPIFFTSSNFISDISSAKNFDSCIVIATPNLSLKTAFEKITTNLPNIKFSIMFNDESKECLDVVMNFLHDNKNIEKEFWTQDAYGKWSNSQKAFL